MKDTTRAAFAAANTVDATVSVANYATALHRAIPDDWKLFDEAYWLLRAAQETAQNAADALDPEEALDDETILYAFQQATTAVEKACEAADELVSLAEEANHEIRR